MKSTPDCVLIVNNKFYLFPVTGFLLYSWSFGEKFGISFWAFQARTSLGIWFLVWEMSNILHMFRLISMITCANFKLKVVKMVGWYDQKMSGKMAGKIMGLANIAICLWMCRRWVRRHLILCCNKLLKKSKTNQSIKSWLFYLYFHWLCI